MLSLTWEQLWSILQAAGAAIVLISWIVEKTHLSEKNAALEKLDADLAMIRLQNVNWLTLQAIRSAADPDRQKDIDPLISQLIGQMVDTAGNYIDPETADNLKKGLGGQGQVAKPPSGVEIISKFL